MEAIQGLIDGLSFLELELLGKLLLAALLGGVIGWEREWSDKPAGLRTNLLICVGAALLGDTSVHFAHLGGDPSIVRADTARIAAQVVSGIGFLGAGTIIQARGSVTGLTTAATLWVVAAIGLAVGGGAAVGAVGATVLVLVALVPLGRFEDWIAARRRSERSLRLVLALRPGVLEDVEALLRVEGRLEASLERLEKDVEAGRVKAWFGVLGRREDFEDARRRLVGSDDVRELTVTDVTTD